MNLLTLILPAIVPALTDGLRALIGRVTGGAGSQPQNVTEAIELMRAQNERLQALANLDAPAGDVSRWVANLRASFRYLAVGAILGSTIGAIFAGVDEAALLVMLDLSGASMSFVIGERMYLRIRQ